MRSILHATFASLLLLAAPYLAAQPLTGIEGQKAPPLGVSTWINLPPGKERLGLPDFAGKVLVVFCFQDTCEACHEREFPGLQRLVKEFESNEDIAFVAIQTPFERFTDNSELKLRPVAEKFGLSIPFGHLAKTPTEYSINVAYETGGTPWWIVIDKEGVVAFNGHTLEPEVAIANLRTLAAGEAVN